MKKKLSCLCIALLMFFIGGYKVEAASLSISTSSKSVTIGSSVTVTVNASDLAGKFSVSSSDGSVLSGGNSSIWIENGSDSFKFTAKKEGSATITVKTISAASFSSGSAFSESKSVTINVVKPREKSTNNNLKSLTVEGYSLSPEFNKDTLEYSVELPADATKININASKEDSYASVNGTGEKDVIEGDNRFEIVVTSETGSTKTYVINANVKDNNPIVVEIDNKELTVVKRSDSLTKPSEDYIDTKVTISDNEIPAFYNEKNNITVVGLKDEEGSIQLYRYDEKSNTYSKYESLTSASITIISEKITEIPEGYKETTIKIDDTTYTVYKSVTNQNYSLIYGLNLETGEKSWYRYDEKEKTLQVYDNSEIDNLKKEYEEKENTYKLLIIGLGTFTILLLIIILILVLKKGKKKRIVSTPIKNTEDDIYKKDDKQAKKEVLETKEEKQTVLEKTPDEVNTKTSVNKKGKNKQKSK